MFSCCTGVSLLDFTLSCGFPEQPIDRKKSDSNIYLFICFIAIFFNTKVVDYIFDKSFTNFLGF